jgi:hypothetical protein
MKRMASSDRRSDPLNEAHGLERSQVPGECAGEAHHREQEHGVERAGNPPDAFGEPTEEDRSDHLAEVANRDQPADVGRRQFPKPDQNRQHVRDRKRVKRVEEPAGSDWNEDLQMPGREGEPFDTRGNLVI